MTSGVMVRDEGGDSDGNGNGGSGGSGNGGTGMRIVPGEWAKRSECDSKNMPS